MILGTYEDAQKELKRSTNSFETLESRTDQGNKTKEIEEVLRITQNFTDVQPTLNKVPNPFKQNTTEPQKSVGTHSQGKDFEYFFISCPCIQLFSCHKILFCFS